MGDKTVPLPTHRTNDRPNEKFGCRAVKSWWFSFALLLAYVITFQLWQKFPDRTAFVIFGILAVALMSAGLWQAARCGYFVDRSDLVLHALVIVDVGLEAASYEIFNVAAQCIFCTPGDAGSFHNRYNFCWCAAILGLLVGGYHGWALRRRRAQQARDRADEKGVPAPDEGLAV